MAQDPSTAGGRQPSTADTRDQQVATVYAKALLGAAVNAGQVEPILAELDSLVADVLDKFPEWERVLSSALFKPEDKLGMLDRTLAAQASTLMLNFLKVLARHGRLDCLRSLHRQAHRLYTESHGRVPVHVRTATPLAPALEARLKETLRGMVGREPELTAVTDPSLIGGLVLRLGDTVYDGSVSSHLEQMRAAMINRSVHEIQSRRDRFRHPGGN